MEKIEWNVDANLIHKEEQSNFLGYKNLQRWKNMNKKS